MERTSTFQRVQTYNPFLRREEHDRRSLLIYRTLTILTWLLVLAISILNCFKGPWNHATIWRQNELHSTPFSLNPGITNIFWITLLVLQSGYIWHLFSSNMDWANAAANVGSHFILNNLLHTAFIMLWVNSQFWIAEIMLVMNFVNLMILYFRHRATPPFIHIPVSSGPMAWIFVAVLFNGAAMVNTYDLPASVIANIAVWSILVYGMYFLATFGDYTVGFGIFWLSLALAVQQLNIKIIPLQWEFAFVVMSIFLVLSLLASVPAMFGKELTFGREGSVAGERQALLSDDE